MKIILLVLALLYTLMPLDLLPDVFMGLGWLDDIAVWAGLFWYFIAHGKKQEEKKKYFQRRGKSHEEISGEAGDGDDRLHDTTDRHNLMWSLESKKERFRKR